jgi:VanZ family protein
VKYFSSEKRRRWLTAYAPLLFWTALTLGLGTGVGSMSETSRILKPLLEYFSPSADAETLRYYQIYIRKLAHVFQYGVLGALAYRAFIAFRFQLILAVLFVAFVAAIDEFNQSFNPARTSNAWDVALDVAGGILAILFYRYFTQKRKRQ